MGRDTSKHGVALQQLSPFDRSWREQYAKLPYDWWRLRIWRRPNRSGKVDPAEVYLCFLCRPVVLGSSIDIIVQMYLRKVRDRGACWSCNGCCKRKFADCDKTKLVEFGGYVQLNRHWAYAPLSTWSLSRERQPLAKTNKIQWFCTGEEVVPCWCGCYCRNGGNPSRTDYELEPNKYQDCTILHMDKRVKGCEPSRDGGCQLYQPWQTPIHQEPKVSMTNDKSQQFSVC